MRRFRVGEIGLATATLTMLLGAAPAAPTYRAVEQPIVDIRKAWEAPGAKAEPHGAAWNTYFDDLLGELRAYSSADNENARVKSLNRIYQIAMALQAIPWEPAQRVRDELFHWLTPRVRLAWAERQLDDALAPAANSPDPAVRENTQQWRRFVDKVLSDALRQHDAAETVAQRQEALKRIYGALQALQADSQRRMWSPSASLHAALTALFNQPNLDISADVATLAPALEHDLVQSGPVERRGYISQVTAGAKTGFGLLPSDDGIAFYNRQQMVSVTPIWDFNSQMAQDPRGQRATKLYAFGATSVDYSELTVTAVIRPSGLSLSPAFSHSTDATIKSVKTEGHGLGRAVAAMIGMTQPRITQKVYDGAIDKIRENVVTEALEESTERMNAAAAEQNAKFAQYLIGNDSLAIRNLLISGLTLRSRPENALLGGTLEWRGAAEQVGADAPQPISLARPAAGVSADVHLTSIITSLSRGYLQSDRARSVENLMVVTRKVPPNAPPREAFSVEENVSYDKFLTAVKAAADAHDPKVTALRVKRPSKPPQFAADARGYLVALVPDFQLEVPAPEQAAQGGLGGIKAKVLRVVSPQAEFVISFKITPQTEKEPVRLTGRVEGFDPGPQGRVFAVNDAEKQATQINAFSSALILGVFRAKLQGQPIDVPLSNLKMEGFAIRDVSNLDPTGWMRVNLARTSPSPAAGVR
jgi:hypothetical protein